MVSKIPPNAVEIKKLDVEDSNTRVKRALWTLTGAAALEILVLCLLSSYIPTDGDKWDKRFDNYSVFNSTLEYILIAILRLVTVCAGVLLLKTPGAFAITAVKGVSRASRIFTIINHINFLYFVGDFVFFLLKSRHFDEADVLVCSLLVIVFGLASMFLVSSDVAPALSTHAKDKFALEVLTTLGPLDPTVERTLFPADEASDNPFAAPEGAQLSVKGMMKVLRPFFWPQGRIQVDEEGRGNATGKSVWMLRVRAVSTWLCVGISKAASVYSPLIMGDITRRLVNNPTDGFVVGHVGLWVLLNLIEKAFREMQSVAYIPVKQEAAVELRETTFSHLVQKMGYEWHVKRKLGAVMRAIDRGADAANSLTHYGILLMGPSFVEAVVICFIFLFMFKSASLTAIVFGGVFLYCYLTVMITNWRAKLRKEANKRDNKVHDVMTDCLVNIETVKAFANEGFEVRRFSNQVRAMLHFSSATEKSLAVLNGLQQAVVFLTVGGALLVAGFNIVDGGDMDVGDFAAVLSYTTKVFAPFSILGTIYNMVVQSLVDIRNLSQLLAMQSDIVDKPDAPAVSAPAPGSKATAVKFNNVFFQYQESMAAGLLVVDAYGRVVTDSPAATTEAISKQVATRYKAGAVFRLIEEAALRASQHVTLEGGEGKVRPLIKGGGLRGVTFEVKEGQTLGVVGHTGAGKTTLTRVLMRFLEASEGAVEIYGKDVRDVTQSSLRGDIFGVVPQDCVLFNDSILYNLLYGHRDAQRVLANISGQGTQAITSAKMLRDAMGAEAFAALMVQVTAAVEAAQLMDFVNKAAENEKAKRQAEGKESTETSQEDDELSKWDILVGERGLKLSGGEKQRVSIARCLLKNPKILIFDEATSSLDTQTEALVQKAIDTLTAGVNGIKRTCIVIAHRLSTIRRADAILVLHNGQVAEMGSHQELLSVSPVEAVSLLDDVGYGRLARTQPPLPDGRPAPLGIYARLWDMQLHGAEEMKKEEEGAENSALLQPVEEPKKCPFSGAQNSNAPMPAGHPHTAGQSAVPSGLVASHPPPQLPGHHAKQ